MNYRFHESDWQLFKQALSTWFNASEHIELDYRFSRSCMLLNIISLISKGIIKTSDLFAFSPDLQTAVRLHFAEVRPA